MANLSTKPFKNDSCYGYAAKNDEEDMSYILNNYKVIEKIH